MEIAGEELQTQAMDHHGLVAGMCQELGIAKRINQRIDKGDTRRVVSPGQAVVAMIINGLGFTNRRLYLSHQFFETKPVEQLLGPGIAASDITDHTLGLALDEIATYGASRLFGEVAFGVALDHQLLSTLNHLDTTSLSVHGEYGGQNQEGKSQEGERQDKEVSYVEITHGYSKDHRPDLKQVVLSLVVNGPAAMPLFMEPLNGNSSDKQSFPETINKVRAFQRQINLEKDFKWVGDSALYTKEGLLKQNDYLWLTRVPETLKEARLLVEKPDETISWKALDKGYKIAPFTSEYGDMAQRWLLVYSEQAYLREKKTLEKQLEKKDQQIKNALWHLGNELFACEADAKKALAKLAKAYPFYTVQGQFVPELRYAKKGRPKAGDQQEIAGFRILATSERNQQVIDIALNKKGRFILATNDLNETTFPNERMLSEYKEQQKVEHGFRFLKDPWFMVDSIFLKSPKRIEALMMVMTLCLLVYNVAQYKLRETLKQNKETLPNQLGKEVQNSTLRWIFQIMEGISVVRLQSEHTATADTSSTKTFITNLTPLRKKIIMLFGPAVCRMYGVIPKSYF